MKPTMTGAKDFGTGDQSVLETVSLENGSVDVLQLSNVSAIEIVMIDTQTNPLERYFEL